MGHTAIKVSDALASEARLAAADSDRSLTGQIEHWARLGRAIEPALPTSLIAALKKSGLALDALENEAEKALVLDALARLRQSPPYANRATALRQSHGPLYEADPNQPGGVLRVNEDGTRTPGQFTNREFVEERNSD